MSKLIYRFGAGETEGSAGMKEILGGKGANLAEMARLGLPVPPGFTLSTELCRLFYKEGKTLPDFVKEQIKSSLKFLEKKTGKVFGDPENPLLVSVRSGAPVSMPGMMDTILNLGLNDKTAEGLARKTNNPAFACDSHRRFVQMYSEVVMGMNPSLLEVYLEDYKKTLAARPKDGAPEEEPPQKEKAKPSGKEEAPDAQSLQNAEGAGRSAASHGRSSDEQRKKIIAFLKEIVLQDTGRVFPEDPMEQLWEAIQAVFLSCENPRAKIYRQFSGETSPCETAVNIQSMVFGNRGKDSATGVVFTRNPSTGEKGLFGEFLPNAQGEDIVAGFQTPFPVTAPDDANRSQNRSLQSAMPEIFKSLQETARRLELHYKYIQDIEFTIEKGRLYLLQTRDGKCAAAARLKILNDLMEEGVLDEKEALLRIPPASLKSLLHPSVEVPASAKPLTKGLPAGPGGASGKIVFSSRAAEEQQKKGEPVLLLRTETSPEDINGMIAAEGVLTLRGGMTSHAAVVARSMGKPCVVGCEEAEIDEAAKTVRFPSLELKEGDFLTLDGGTGCVFEGSLKTRPAALNDVFFRFMEKADQYARLQTLANADTPEDAQKALDLGAKGIGLCRTEHMFFAKDRIPLMRKMILSSDSEEKNRFLNELFVFQKQDFQKLFTVMNGLPVTIRLLDPPLHEFLPQREEEISALAKDAGWDREKARLLSHRLKEVNPMLGHRGCRLAVSHPEIYLMQARAVAEAAAAVLKNGGRPTPEIMIPFTAAPKEFQILKDRMREELQKIQPELNIPIGTMIELPSACLRADEIAREADFFSFGANDLTQTVLGVSRDDCGKFLPLYISKAVFAADPFVTIDKKSVGELIKSAAAKGKSASARLKIGVCGEQGGDPESIDFFHKIPSMNYISCSPYRIPAARLAAAQAALKQSDSYTGFI